MPNAFYCCSTGARETGVSSLSQNGDGGKGEGFCLKSPKYVMAELPRAFRSMECEKEEEPLIWHPWLQETAKELTGLRAPPHSAGSALPSVPEEKPASKAGRKPLLSASRLPVIGGSVSSALASGEFRSHEASRVTQDFLLIREVGRGWASPPDPPMHDTRCVLNLAEYLVLFMKHRPEIERELLHVDVLASLESKKQKYLSHNIFYLNFRQACYVIVT